MHTEIGQVLIRMGGVFVTSGRKMHSYMELKSAVAVAVAVATDYLVAHG